MRRVIDASAVLAVCKQEEGMIEARRKMRNGIISAVNLSEVFTVSLRHNKRAMADAIVQTAELTIVAFDERSASLAASLEDVTRHMGISFADRACLALGISEQKPVLTGDHRWADLNLGVELDFFRTRVN